MGLGDVVGWKTEHDEAVDTVFTGERAMEAINSAISKAQQKQTVCFDFDGVLSYHESGWPISKIGKPLEKGFEKVREEQAAGNRIVVLTARPEELHDQIYWWLKQHGLQVDDVTNVKPPALRYYDDRAIMVPKNWGQMKESGVKGQRWGIVHQKQKKGPLSTERKSELAKSSYVPQNKEKVALAHQSADQIAKALGGKHTTEYNNPFDVVIGRTVCEVKTIFPTAKNDKVTVHTESKLRKLKAMQEGKIRKGFVVASDRRAGFNKPVFYAKAGFGSYRLGGMTKLRGLKHLKEFILGKVKEAWEAIRCAASRD